MQPRTCFALVAGAGVAYIHGYVMLSLPAFRLPNRTLTTPACFSLPGMEYYPFLGRANQALCAINAVFFAARSYPAAAPMLDVFIPVFLALVIIATYESFRPAALASRSSWPRRALGFLMFGQLMTAGCAMPAFFSLVLRHTWPEVDNRPRPAYVWATLVSTVLGMVVPTANVDAADWAYGALSLWQPFPLYMIALNLVLPTLFSGASSRKLPILGLVGLTTLVSLRGHRSLLAFVLSLTDIYITPWFTKGTTRPEAGGLLFLADFTFCTLATTSWVILGLAPSVAGWIGYLLVFGVGSVLAGPGAAIIALWAYGELGAKGRRGKLE